MTANKWRPTLSMIVTAMVGAALLLPVTGILFFRIYENQLLRSTESELIAQSAGIAAAMSQWLETHSEIDLPLGRELPSMDRSEAERWDPTLPKLNLHQAEILPERPDARVAKEGVASIYAEAGRFMNPILMRTQQATLAGFRILDFNGTVIAGRNEVGSSLAHIPEVEGALQGNYTSVLRKRIVDEPQPIYSISRGTSVRVFTALPITIDERLAGIVYASRTPSNVVKELFFLRDRLALAGFAILALALFMVLVFSRAIASPIHHLRDRAQRIGKGDRDAIGPLLHHGSREIYELSNALMDTSRKLFERTDYINSFATHVSHELKSPLTSIGGAVELLKDSEMTAQEQARFLDNIARDSRRCTMLLERLRTLAKADNVDIRGECRLGDVLDRYREPYPQLTIQWSGNPEIPMSEENASIVFDNLLDNAEKHGACNVVITTLGQGNNLEIEIRDDGNGISPGNAPRVFDLFFTTRRQSGGTGLGLGIVRSLLHAHKADIKVEDSEQGACFRISFSGAKI